MPSLPIAFRVALLAAIACAAAFLCAARQAEAQTLGIATGGDTQNLPLVELERELDLIAAAGAGWVRVDINWAQIQAGGPASYEWAATDRVIAAARARGLRVLGVIVYTPAWARPAGTAATYRPDPGRYAAFAARAVRRYSPAVRHWEIWNEPNVRAFWTPKPNAQAYVRVLRAAYAKMRQADPRAKVLTGGTAPAVSDGTDIAPVDWLERLYRHGARGSFTAVAHHPYCWPALPGEALSWSAWYQIRGTNRSLRSVMKDNDDAGKRIWLTEFGAPTGGPPGSFVSEAAQAQMIKRAHEKWGKQVWMGPLFVYEARDHGSDFSTREDFFGLLRRDFTPKPAYWAFSTMARATTPAGRGPDLRLTTARNAALGPFVRVRLVGEGKRGGRMLEARLQCKRRGTWRYVAGRKRRRTNASGAARIALRALRRSLPKGTYRVRIAIAGGTTRFSPAMRLKRRLG